MDAARLSDGSTLFKEYPQMKKVFSLVLAGALILAAATAFADAKRLTLATGGTSGVYFPLGGAIGQVLTSKSNGALATVQGGKSACVLSEVDTKKYSNKSLSIPRICKARWRHLPR